MVFEGPRLSTNTWRDGTSQRDAADAMPALAGLQLRAAHWNGAVFAGRPASACAVALATGICNGALPEASLAVCCPPLQAAGSAHAQVAGRRSKRRAHGARAERAQSRVAAPAFRAQGRACCGHAAGGGLWHGRADRNGRGWMFFVVSQRILRVFLKNHAKITKT